MCGIVGVISPKSGSLKMAVDALQRLEYRGYDSFGVSVLDGSGIRTKRSIGSVSMQVKNGFLDDVADGTSVIAHTRWATHGGVTEANAHPHVSYDGMFSVVHNGVVENYRALQQKLAKKGIQMRSETDTETIAHLLAMHYEATGNVMAALQKTLGELTGEYAIVFSTIHEPGKLFGTRRKSPLGLAESNGLGIIASDQRAVGPLAEEMIFLEDGDIAVVSPAKAEVFTQEGTKVRRIATKLLGGKDESGLDGNPHYMIKEIHEAPIAAERAFAINEKQIEKIAKDMLKKDIAITGAGSSFYVAMISQYFFAHLAKKYVKVHQSDEILSLVPFDTQTHLVAVSQSGETFDTMEVMRAALEQKSVVTAINNVIGSSSQRIATFPIFQGSGAEICVLSTKSIISQTLILYRIAKKLGELNGTLSAKEAKALAADEKKLPEMMRTLFTEMEPKIKFTAGWNRHVDNWFFIGRDAHYPIALEGALKFKEVSYWHAEGMPAGFFKHGTISLIDEHFYTVAFLPPKSENKLFGLMASNIAEIRARGGNVIAFGHDADVSAEIPNLTDYIALPDLNEHLNPLFELLAGQLLAYYCAVALGRNIDKPRALAKAVTVR